MSLPLATSLPEGGLSTLDLVVIATYLVGMLGMGTWISFRQKSTEDFFVGGRNLPAWAVGISLLASLLSTITYLGMPGEMFRSGLGFLTRRLFTPFVLVVVCFLWVPFFMRLRLTSAYEYLEKRFDYPTRALASSFCLLLLFGWMAVVVLTASKAMSEITVLDLDLGFVKNIPATRTAEDGSALINPEDIEDWPTLLSRLQDEGDAELATPAGRLWEFLPDTLRNTWPLIPEGKEPAAALQWKLAEALTDTLKNPDLYDGSEENTEWRGVPIPRTARVYLKAGLKNLSPQEVTVFNRFLVEAAFPDEIAPTRPAYRDADMYVIILAIGMFSVLYTTLGGIRAVVWTDVIQFFILIAGAFFTMGVIAWGLDSPSSLSDWIRVSQERQHEQVEWFSWDVGNRSTVTFIATGMFFWFICTHGANQIALQRYFSVRNIRAARWSYVTGEVSSLALGVILAGVGISLMYFVQYHELPASAGLHSAVDSIRNESQDKVFPQFIRYYLPSGLRGMVVAALFAAAMSTIDSGANSVSTIVTVDFFRRLYPQGANVASELRLARILTATMGLIVVACTIFLYHISKGTDLISLCQKGFNCFLGPLGGLFVLAMFSRRTVGLTAIPAVLVGEVIGVCTSYSMELFAIPFSTHLVIPASWLATIVTGWSLSLLLGTHVSPEQQQWMWREVLRTPAVDSTDTVDESAASKSDEP